MQIKDSTLMPQVINSIKRILIVNPNSSSEITIELEKLLEPNRLKNNFEYVYMTGPSGGPESIDDYTTEISSASNCLGEILKQLDYVDAVLIACYSDHPLVHILREQTRKPVIGIFHASVLHSLAIGGGKFAIVTTGKAWERLLDEGVRMMLGINEATFAGTFSTGLGVLELHRADPEFVRKRIAECSKAAVDAGAVTICLGCAGMAGMEEAVRSGAGDKVKVIDGVVAGVEILIGMIRANY